jgi:hypothetical protein
MIVRPHNNKAETMLSTTEEFSASSIPKYNIRKLITANETE